jgi:hypothetical protein
MVYQGTWAQVGKKEASEVIRSLPVTTRRHGSERLFAHDSIVLDALVQRNWDAAEADFENRPPLLSTSEGKRETAREKAAGHLRPPLSSCVQRQY